MTRPAVLAFVSGTGTDVGKTWWSAEVARQLVAAGRRVAARKPAQSGDAGGSDRERLAAATGESVERVCPAHRCYSLAWAPPMAAAELGRQPFGIADLVGECTWEAGTDVGLVEGAGGPRSPIAVDGDNVALARALAPDVVILVADAGLGTINAVRLSADAFDGLPTVVAMNRYVDEGLAAANRDRLAADGYDIVTDPEVLARRLTSMTSTP